MAGLRRQAAGGPRSLSLVTTQEGKYAARSYSVELYANGNGLLLQSSTLYVTDSSNRPPRLTTTMVPMLHQ